MTSEEDARSRKQERDYLFKRIEDFADGGESMVDLNGNVINGISIADLLSFLNKLMQEAEG